MELGAILLLEATNLVHINGVELALGLLLISRQLLVVHGLQADSGVVANTDDKNAATLGATLVILLVREGDVDLRDVVRRVRRRVRVGEHGATVPVDDEDAGAAVVRRLDGKATGVVVALVVIVRGQAVVLLALGLLAHELHAAGAAEEEEDGDEDEGDEGNAEDDEHEVDHAVGAVVGGHVGSPSSEVVDRRHDEGEWSSK